MMMVSDVNVNVTCQKPLSSSAVDDDVLTMIMSGHNVLMKVLSSRNNNLQVVKAMWSAGNVKVFYLSSVSYG